MVTRQQLKRLGITSSCVDRLSTAGGLLRRVTRGVYQVARMSASDPALQDLRATWLQLAPDVTAPERVPAQGVVSHYSAAALYGLCALPRRHDFTVAACRRTRRQDVRLHIRPLPQADTEAVGGILVTSLPRTATDLLRSARSPDVLFSQLAGTARPREPDTRAPVPA
jgi:predicted transcriptional regulator of viral defense system